MQMLCQGDLTSSVAEMVTNKESSAIFSIQPKSALPESSNQDFYKFQLADPSIG